MSKKLKTTVPDQEHVAGRRNIALGLLSAIGSASLPCGPHTLPKISPSLTTGKFLPRKPVRWFDTIAIQQSPALSESYGEEGEIAVALGYHHPGDGGGGIFLWSSAPATDNRGTIINPAYPATLPTIAVPEPTLPVWAAGWRRIYEGAVLVEWFGARGTSSGHEDDDFGPINAALAFCALHKRNLALRPGRTYLCKKAYIRSNIEGNDAVLKGQLCIVGSNVRVENLTIESFEPNVVLPNVSLAIYIEGNEVGIENIALSNVKTRFTQIPPGSRCAMTARGVSALTLNGCAFLYGVELVRCANFRVENCLFDGDDFNNNTELLQATIRSFGVITGNIFRNSLDNFLDLSTSGERTVVSANRFDGCRNRHGTAVEIKIFGDGTGVNTSSTANGFVEEIVFSSNIITNLQPFKAQPACALNIYYIGRFDDDQSRLVRNVVVSSNIIEAWSDEPFAGNCLFRGISLHGVRGSIVSNNIIRKLSSAAKRYMAGMVTGIWIQNCRELIVAGNEISADRGDGIALHGDIEDCVFSGNVIGTDSNAREQCRFAILVNRYPKEDAASVRRCNFNNNNLFGTISAFRLSSEAGSLVDCIFSGNHFREFSTFQNLQRCSFVGNSFHGADQSLAIELGSAKALSSHIKFIGNSVCVDAKPDSPPRGGLQLLRVRASILSGNTFEDCSPALVVIGLKGLPAQNDHLIIKDNIATNHGRARFPVYAGLHPIDLRTIVNDANLIVN